MILHLSDLKERNRSILYGTKDYYCFSRSADCSVVAYLARTHMYICRGTPSIDYKKKINFVLKIDCLLLKQKIIYSNYILEKSLSLYLYRYLAVS